MKITLILVLALVASEAKSLPISILAAVSALAIIIFDEITYQMSEKR